MKRINRTRLFVGTLVALIVCLALLASRHEGGHQTPPTRLSDTTPEGGRALGMVVERLGYKTQSQYAPLSQMPADARLWFVLDSSTTFSDKEADALLKWVRGGGTLFWAPPAEQFSFFSDSNSNRPGVDRLKDQFGIETSGQPSFDSNGFPKMVALKLDSVSNYRAGVSGASGSGTTLSVSPKPSRGEAVRARGAFQVAGPIGGSIVRLDEGRGHIFLFPDAWMLCNYGISQPANATLLANLVRADRTSVGGTAYFDERQHDNTLAPPTPDDWPARLRQKPVVFALWQLFLVGLGTLALVSRRLGAPVPLPTHAPVTRASGFARAMGGLLLKASRPKAAAQIIGESFRARLAKRVGMSPRESDEVLAARAHEISGIDREVLSRALMNSRAPATNETSALRDAQQMERILEQLG